MLLGSSAALVAACGAGPDTGPGGGDTDGSPAPISGQLTVLAAASLTETFTTLGEQFEQNHPGVTVTFGFGGSSTLATQITHGAPADVFAAANESTMKTVLDAGLAVEAQPFASNTLQIAVPAGNPGAVDGLADFADERLRIALCAPQVPCGAAAGQVFAAAAVNPKPDTLEADVKAVTAKVAAGEVDAALVYRSDVLAAGDEVEGVDVAEAAAAVNVYPITALVAAPNRSAAEAFVGYVTSEDGQQVLADAGFDPA